MEEGPEPHEMIERTVEHHHHQEDHPHEGGAPSHMVPAITAAILAVCAALGSLLSGHAANQAILLQTKATDHWNYFQATSAKGHLYEIGGDIVGALADPRAVGGNPKTTEVLERFQHKATTYGADKKALEEKARELEHESDHEFHQHHYYALGIVAFQVGIVMASISILVKFPVLYYLSLLAGAAGLICTLVGLIT